jgi:hypothetical protein
MRPWGVAVSVGALSFEVPDTTSMNWFRGNTHAHSYRSVGKSSPSGLVTWYRNNGYQFLVITDDTYPSAPEVTAQSSDASFIGDDGLILLTTSQNPAIFVLAEKLTYVRAKVTDSSGKAAWIQPVFVQ